MQADRPLIVWSTHERYGLLWHAAPPNEIYIEPGKAPVIGARYTRGRLFAFTDSEKLFLPDPPVSGSVVTIALRLADLAAAPRVARSPQRDIDDLDYEPNPR